MNLPIREWLSTYSTEKAQRDVIAGITTAVMLIPQAMAYALLADLPTYVGLYAAAIPPIIYGFLGTSRALALGPVAIDSLLTASIVGAIVSSGTEDYLLFCSLLAVLAGGIQMLLGILQLGFLVKYLSRPVIGGFLTGAAFIIAANQIKLLLGIPLPQTSFLPKILIAIVQNVSTTDISTLCISLLSICILVSLKKYAPKLPRALLSIIIATISSLFFALSIDQIGYIPPGLPSFSLPHFTMDFVLSIITGAFTIAMVGFMEAFSVGTHLQRTEDIPLRADKELIAVGLGNFCAGCFQGYPVSAGLSRSAVSDSAGAQTPVCSIVNGIFVCGTLLFLSPLLTSVPKATLGSIIFVAIVGFIDGKEPHKLWKINRVDLCLYATTFVCTIFIGIQTGIIIGIVLSLGLSIRFKRKKLTMTSVQNNKKFQLQIVGDLCFLNVDKVINHIKEHKDILQTNTLQINSDGLVDSTAVQKLQRLSTKIDMTLELN